MSPFSTTPRSLLDSTSRRSRKRQQRQKRLRTLLDRKARTTSVDASNDAQQKKVKSSSQSWRVLWPEHMDTSDPPASDGASSVRRSTYYLPSIGQFQRGWARYKKTWEDGIQGRDPGPTSQKSNSVSSEGDPTTGTNLSPHDIQDNAQRNLETARAESQEVLSSLQEKTGIHSKDDLRSIASEAMMVATDCLKEFMDGYRKGRDDEVDKMLHDYFQNLGDDEKSSDANNNDKNAATTRKQRRKPKRATLRTS